jgi:hypothetical protein
MQNARARNARAEVLLSTETETLNQGTVTVDVDALEVIKHTTTVTDHEQQTTTGVVIVLVLLQVLGQVGDTLAQQRDLDLGGTRVAFVRRVLGDDFLLFFSRKCHGILLMVAARCTRLYAGALSIRGRNTPMG